VLNPADDDVLERPWCIYACFSRLTKAGDQYVNFSPTSQKPRKASFFFSDHGIILYKEKMMNDKKLKINLIKLVKIQALA
jgi:hypothetical protein